MVDVLVAMGKLTREDHERWRFRQVPYLEKIVSGNLSQLDAIVRAVRNNSLKGGLRPSHTAYVSWGKGQRQPLRFTKTGNPFLEEAYSTHYLPAKAKTTPAACEAHGTRDSVHSGTPHAPLVPLPLNCDGKQQK